MKMEKLKTKLIRLPGGRLVWSLLNLFRKQAFLKESGWLKSIIKNDAVDKQGSPVPWIAYGCTYFLEPRLSKDFKVFEFGSGNSTLWWAKHVKQVTSVEYDKKWMKLINNKAPENVKIVYSTLEGRDYEESIVKQKVKYEIIMIDGRKRVESTKTAIKSLSKDGVIVFDNAERERYKLALELLRSEGFKSLEFNGPLPISHKSDLTIIFYREDNCLGI